MKEIVHKNKYTYAQGMQVTIISPETYEQAVLDVQEETVNLSVNEKHLTVHVNTFDEIVRQYIEYNKNKEEYKDKTVTI